MYACLYGNVYMCAFGQVGPEKGRDQGRRKKKPEQSKTRKTQDKTMKISVCFPYTTKCLF